ncbi:MAG TPA: LacI family DNA-binding transcriptional regulator [Trebonia sp.]|jgi:DNA-binding LacI/PurR family transcriptional regulator|nr:LacI family DNA-binding transcriptional regulator [Trebonia sp.]
MTEKRVTLRDVAAAAGVSRATAGFVLSDAPGITISEPTKQRVRQTAQDLGYVPHSIARALREGSSRIIVLTIDSGYEGNYSRTFTRGLDDELAARGHVLLVRHGHSAPGSQQRLIEAISPRAVLRMPNYLESGHELDDGGWAGGLAGNVAVQLRYLAGRGHQLAAVALPAGDPPLGPVRLRFAREAAEMTGLKPPPYVAVPRDRPAAVAALGEFMDAHPAVTAFAAFDDDVALCLLAAARDLGLNVPGDVAVIGFDDTDYGALFTPTLTTVHINAAEHGRRAARVILGLDNDVFTPSPAQVIVRESA